MLRQVLNFLGVKDARPRVGGGEMSGETILGRRWVLGLAGRRGFESVGKKGFLGSSREEEGRALKILGCGGEVRL